MNQELRDNYSFLLEDDLLNEIEKHAVVKEFAAGDEIIRQGQYIKSIPLLIKGTIKVSRKDNQGDEIMLYYIEEGETCAISMNCCLGNSKSQILARAETQTKLLMISVDHMDEWMSNYRTWREFVLSSFQTRLNEAINTIDSLVFLKMEERLIHYLRDKTKIMHDTTIHITHQEIANDFHTSRVVISRLLKKMELDGDVALHRNSIEVINL